MTMKGGPEFLKQKYELHKSPEVKSAARRTKMRMKKELPQRSAENPEARIQNYLDRLREIISRENPEEKERGMEALKQILHDKFVIKSKEIPESYFDSIKRKHREEGHGDIEIPEDLKQELVNTIIVEQKDSLNLWIDYLASEDAKYPDELKYWAIRSILKMGRYDKKKEKFTDRYGGTISPFPDLNREALALIFEAMEKKHSGKGYQFGYDIEENAKKQFLEALEKGNFSKLYALTIEEFNPIAEELLRVTHGVWKKYSKGSNPEQLVTSLKRKGTGWCIAGEPTARRYLSTSDLEVFYSLDQEGKFNIPRVVIVRQNGSTSEVRGVAAQENLDPYIGGIVQEKLKEFPDGAVYEKKAQAMKLLTAVENKTRIGQELSKDDLVFLYEINNSIEGFGYQKDPRIKELRDMRNLKQDLPIIFECVSEQIAFNIDEVKENTKAYIGKWSPEIYGKLPNNVQYIYEEFPDKKVFLRDLELDPTIKNAKIAEKALVDKGHKISSWGGDILKKTRFNSEKNSFKLVSFSVGSLGFPNGATTGEIFDKAKKLGLELAPAEIGPQMRLQYVDQPMNEYLYIAMEPIADSVGDPRVFKVVRYDDGSWLNANYADPDFRWLASIALSSCLASNAYNLTT